jgi:hypothetical protein
VTRLHGAAEGAKLATAGDRIDFVVTLGMTHGHAFGRLERQTAEGRVAIRELEAARCDEVADAVALTLTLAQDPNAAGADTTPPFSATGTASATSLTPATATVAEPSLGAAQRNVLEPARSAVSTPNVMRAAPEQAVPKRKAPPRYWLGADMTLYKGAIPDPLPGLRLFLDFHADAPWPGASARIAAFLSNRARESNPAVDLQLAGGRLDACPAAFFGPVVELRPCLAVDLGWEKAQGTTGTGLADSAFWASGSAVARVAWRARRAFALEAELGPTIPFTRYELVEKESGAVIHRTEVIGLSAALGVAFGLP